jgi:hypothetical protein
VLPRCPLSPLTEADSDHGLLAGHLPMRQVLFSSGSAGAPAPMRWGRLLGGGRLGGVAGG